MRAPSFHLSVEVRLGGELDALSAPQILAELLALASAAHADEFVVDLSGAAFVDSAGLKPLVEAQTLLNGRGRKLTLRGVSRAAAHLIRGAELAGSLNVHDIAADDEPRPVPVLPAQRARLEFG